MINCDVLLWLSLQNVVIEGDAKPSSKLVGDSFGKGGANGLKGHGGGSGSPSTGGNVGAVIGIIASGFSGLQHGGHGANGQYGMNSLQNSYTPQGCAYILSLLCLPAYFGYW